MPDDYDSLTAAHQASVDQFQASEALSDDMVLDKEQHLENTKRQKTMRESANRAHNSRDSSGSLSASNSLNN